MLCCRESAGISFPVDVELLPKNIYIFCLKPIVNYCGCDFQHIKFNLIFVFRDRCAKIIHHSAVIYMTFFSEGVSEELDT
jgi:hypothetical protein